MSEKPWTEIAALPANASPEERKQWDNLKTARGVLADSRVAHDQVRAKIRLAERGLQSSHKPDLEIELEGLRREEHNAALHEEAAEQAFEALLKLAKSDTQ